MFLLKHLLLFAILANTGFAAEKVVRVVYLVSADRETDAAYAAGAENAIRSIREWYKKQMGGYTFNLHDPVVEVVKSGKPAAYFYTNPRPSHKDNWGFDNTLEEANRLLGVRHNDPNTVWVIYSDGPGNSGRGGGGVCIMPEDDLLGLTGRHPTQKDINRWIAGLGHELGHALGLPHPKDMKKHADAIMASGIYGKYPDQTYLTEEDKALLRQSPFFFDAAGNPVAGKNQTLAVFSYGTGRFTRSQNSLTHKIAWQEINPEGESFRFDEEKADAQFYYLRAVDRKIWIKIPLAGGPGSLSVDGRVWRAFQNMTVQK